MTTENVINESAFASRWLLRHHCAHVREILISGESVELQSAQLRELFLRELLRLFNAKHQQGNDLSEWLEIDVVGELLVFDTALTAGEALLCLLAPCVSRIDWTTVAQLVREFPDDWEHGQKKIASAAHRGAIVAVNVRTKEREEFSSLKAASAAGFNPYLVRKSIVKNVKYKGCLWGWKPSRDVADFDDAADDQTEDNFADETLQLVS